jgi:hypothetical protein
VLRLRSITEGCAIDWKPRRPDDRRALRRMRAARRELDAMIAALEAL